MNNPFGSHRGRPPRDFEGLHAPAAKPLQIEVTPDRDRMLVRAAGDVDLATAATLESRIVDLLRNGYARVVVDLRGVTFIDSCGIRALLNAHEHARESGRSISIILSAALKRTFEVSGVTRCLELELELEAERGGVAS